MLLLKSLAVQCALVADLRVVSVFQSFFNIVRGTICQLVN